MPKPAKTSGPRFEEGLKRLEEIVQELETSEIPLDRAIELFEEGVKLSRSCLQRLDEAEKKIEILLKGADGTLREEPFGGDGIEGGNDS